MFGLGEESKSLGKTALILLDNFLASHLDAPVRAGVAPLAAEILIHGGECSEAEIARAISAGKAAGVDLVIGIGGGNGRMRCRYRRPRA